MNKAAFLYLRVLPQNPLVIGFRHPIYCGCGQKAPLGVTMRKALQYSYLHVWHTSETTYSTGK